MISVITPVFNGEKYIESCINVVVNQKCPCAEHIIVDGGSTDRTVEIIEKLDSKHSQLKWITEPDKGQSDAMNKGISMAKGEIIGILNVDDFYEPNVLNRIIRIFQTLPEPSLLVGNCNILGSNDKISYVNKPCKLNIVDLIMLKSPFPMNPASYFYHKSLHEKIGLYNVSEHFTMDLEFILKAVQHAYVKYCDELWGNHRHIAGTKTVNLKKQGVHSQYLKDFLDKQRRNLPLIYKLKLFPIILRRKIRYVKNHPRKIFPDLWHRIK